MTELPVFIDPIPEDAGEAVGEAGVPRWLAVCTVVVLAFTAYYLLAFATGPRLSSPHTFVPGRAAWVGASPSPPATAGTPAPAPTAPSAAPSDSPSASPTP